MSSKSNTLIWAIALVLITGIASFTLILITMDSSQVPQGWLGLFLGFLGTSIVALANLARTDKVDNKLDRVLNGEMSQKIRDNVHAVLDERESTATREVSPNPSVNGPQVTD